MTNEEWEDSMSYEEYKVFIETYLIAVGLPASASEVVEFIRRRKADESDYEPKKKRKKK